MNLTACIALAALVPIGAAHAASPSTKPTFCIEWVRQSREGYERLTLFTDRTVVWKTVDGRGEQVRRKTLTSEELDFYCSYFTRREVWELPNDLRTGLTGEFTGQSSVTAARKDGLVKRVRFDDLSALTADAAALRAALEGLKSVISNPLAPASRFTADVLTPGTVLKRFDGAIFRVLRIEKEKGVVEIAGVNEPYSQFVKLEELRFQFSPPE
ncbi:MAG TPA: hypothetical protein VGQ75_06900 [Thermoanaerobaculia bacterium]|nr:hypothetical protein [Thermoanaerobaculia bacterium]